MPDWFSILPIGDVQMLDGAGGSNAGAVDPNAPVFRASTDCPIVTEWLVLAAVAGFVLAYLMKD